MNASPARGAVLVGVAILLGFLILRGITDRQQVPIADGTPIVVADATVEPTASVGAQPITTPTVAPDTSLARPNAEVSVLVANGTAVQGQAGRLTQTLLNQGFLTRPAKNADPFAASVIYYRPGYQAEAEVVRLALQTSTPVAPMPVPDPSVGAGIDLGEVDVFVLIGADDLSTS